MTRLIVTAVSKSDGDASAGPSAGAGRCADNDGVRDTAARDVNHLLRK